MICKKWQFKMRATLLVLTLFSSLLPAGFAQPVPEKMEQGATSQSLITWTALDSYETTKTRILNPRWRHVPSPPNDFIPAISRNDFLDWLKRRGELKNEKQLQVVHKTAMVPSNAILSTWTFGKAYQGAYNKARGYKSGTFDAGKLLDKLDANPEKNRHMEPMEFTPYKEWLGEDWLDQPRKKRIELLKDKIQELKGKYSERREVRWFETEHIVIGVAYYRHYDHIEDDPLESYELIGALADLQAPLVVEDGEYDGKRCILLDPFECMHVPSQSREMVMDYGWGLEPIGIIKRQLVLRARDYLFLYNLETKEFCGSPIFQRDWNELDMILLGDTPYMVTLEPKERGWSIATIWKGDWNIPRKKGASKLKTTGNGLGARNR